MNTNKATKIALKSGMGNSAKDILMSVIGTTISIILTFGTSSLVDYYQERKARKLLAMTVIHEIDKDLEQIRTEAEHDYRLYSIIKYINSFDGQLENVEEDSLFLFHSLLSPYNKLLEFSNSNEQIFNSSQSTWSTIDNNIFISNVQDYYRLRSKLECALKEDACFLPYVDGRDYYPWEYVDGKMVRKTMAETVGQFDIDDIYMKIKDRIFYYNDLLRYKSFNEENKILMGISDKDLEEFVKKTADATIVSPDQLIGTWMIKNYDIDLYGLNNGNGNIFIFNKNNTITIYNNRQYKGQKIGAGDIVVYYAATGEWKIEGDSLVMTFPDDKIEVQIDDNDFYFSKASHWRDTKNNIEDATLITSDNKRDFIIDFCGDFGSTYKTPPCVISVTAFIDRLGRAFTIRTSNNLPPRRFERCDNITIPTYDFVKHLASEKEILGKWDWYDAESAIQMEFDNRKDHSFAIMKVDKEQKPDLFAGTLRVKRNISGEWELENDSLVYYFDTKTLDLAIDDSCITVAPGKENLLREFKQQLTATYTQRTLQSPRESYQAIINAKRTEMVDKDGNVMFLYQ